MRLGRLVQAVSCAMYWLQDLGLMQRAEDLQTPAEARFFLVGNGRIVTLIARIPTAKVLERARGVPTNNSAVVSSANIASFVGHRAV